MGVTGETDKGTKKGSDDSSGSGSEKLKKGDETADKQDSSSDSTEKPQDCPAKNKVMEVVVTGEDEKVLKDIPVALSQDDKEELLDLTDKDGKVRLEGLETKKYKLSLYTHTGDAWKMNEPEKLGEENNTGKKKAEWAAISNEKIKGREKDDIKPKEEEIESGNTYSIKTKNFAKVMFFSGSVCYTQDSDTTVDYILDEWNAMDYAQYVRNKGLKNTLSSKDWHYLLNTQKPPVFLEGKKNFRLYNDKEVEDALKLDKKQFFTKGVQPSEKGFGCSSSVVHLKNLPEKIKKNYITEKESTIRMYFDKDDNPIKCKEVKSTTMENMSSRVQVSSLNSFLKDLKKKLTFPIFSVSDCNSFHTSGYLWAKYAIDHISDIKEEPVAILNFDQHYDYSSKAKIVRSDGWGKAALRALPKTSTGIYMSIGQKKDGGISYDRINRNKAPSLWSYKKKFTEVTDWKSFWEQLCNTGFKCNGKAKPLKYVFITVDRDCIKNSFTQWSFAPLQCYFENKDKLKSAIKNIIDPLWELHAPYLIGFDITGLPEHKLIAKSNPDNKEKDAWKQVEDEIKDLHELVKDKLQLTASTFGEIKSSE